MLFSNLRKVRAVLTKLQDLLWRFHEIVVFAIDVIDRVAPPELEVPQ